MPVTSSRARRRQNCSLGHPIHIPPGLLASVPDPTDDTHRELYQIPGLPPDVAQLPPGCPFAPRCARAAAICHEQFPPLVALSNEHHSLCHFAQEIYDGSVP